MRTRAGTEPVEVPNARRAHDFERSAGEPIAVAERVFEPFERFRTSDPGEAQSQAARLFSPHRLRVHPSESAFDAKYSMAGFGATSLYLMRYGAEVTIDRPPQSRYMTVWTPLSGNVEATHQGQEVTAGPGGTQLVFSEADNVHLHLSEDSTVVILRADIEALRSMLSGMIPSTDIGALRFAPEVDSVSTRTTMLGVIHLLTSSLMAQGPTLPPNVERQLRCQALTAVLLGLEHNYSSVIYDPTPQISNHAVRRAIDMINAEETADLTVVDVAREVGISLRALEIGFKKQADMSPGNYLKKVRLHRAHAELLASEATVGQVAMNWGFAHAGRFSRAYRTEFGESPSETLRRTRPRAGSSRQVWRR
ncbi:MAG TPA: AraC family transcriptional regulator [Trebonia sp.]|nr:AraC family transcriptional regulator [Trebonia sp.]